MVSFRLLLLAVFGRAALADPCCTTCESGKEKYYSIPNPQENNPECGECCLDPSRYSFWKVFEPKLLKGDCASQGFTKYTKTETDGVWPLQVANDRYVRANASMRKLVTSCPNHFKDVFADMHDGDQKEVIINGKTITIKPFGNNQTWIVKSELDPDSCSASIDFNVPGKPGPPPVNLSATLWLSLPLSTVGAQTEKAEKAEIEFTDPSGTLAAKSFPLNRWVAHGSYLDVMPNPCPDSLDFIYADMHDGDKKKVTISGASMTIQPFGNNQTWVVKTTLDAKLCNAVIDFNVPGKPGPPPVNLTATLIGSVKAGLLKIGGGVEQKTLFGFTDPSGTLASKDFPLNRWVQISSPTQEGSPEIVV
eukprot:gnl/MRDRNA2_/MRDRNA2_105494_c0_seq1.p1 gnl/MRDRNA2_/MRDRNA2_105494_c0~~gnl/MRDRNA2_/MRDRNA2_105494_c0_seq1.p1  ORF type:complete len:363 (-),score=59.11 gnl/MRDRNA2_/MRDRNA2_105494_c0_seq1:177-1265(-)